MTHYYRQRRSIFGGLILILIGVIFLLYEYHPEMEIGRLFTHYWPLLLILWGVARHFDHLLATRSGEARPPGISGGEIGLIILLLLVVASIAGFDWARRTNPGIDFGLGDMFEHPYDWSSS
ncbi:MAG: LiaI-LiaF-like domain-containing protein, partial [Candidatus Acidiferrales bacterium]